MMADPPTVPHRTDAPAPARAPVDWACVLLLMGVAAVVIAAGYAGQAPWSAHLLAVIWRAL